MKSILAIFVVLLLSPVWAGTQDLKVFTKWCADNGVSFDKIEIKEIEGYGRGVVAKEDIKEGEIFLSVPSTAMITPQVAFETFSQLTFTTENGEVLDGLDESVFEDLSRTNLMALQLLYHKFNENSKWKPFVESFPSNFSEVTLYWSPEELKELQGSTVLEATIRKKGGIARQYEYVMSVLEPYKSVFDKEVYTLDEFQWALIALWSRTFSVQIDGEATGGLVPIADMFNSDKPENIKLRHKMGNNLLELEAAKPIKKGEQIFAPYGREGISNGQLLMDYGFIIEDNPNKMILIPSPLPSSEDPLFDKKKALLDQLNLSSPFIPIPNTEDVPEGLLVVTRVAQANSDEINDPTTYELLKNLQTLSQRNEKATIRTVITHLQRILDRYPTTVQEDEALIQRKNEIPLKQYNSVVVRKHEKEVLETVLSVFKTVQEKLFGDEPEKKKKKKKESLWPSA